MDIEHIAFNVAAPVEMAAWYTKYLGMRVVRSIPSPSHTHFLSDQSGRVVLEFYHRADAPVPDYAGMDPLVLHLAFTPADMTETIARLLAAGATRVGELAVTPAGDELAFLRDPWGLTIQLVR